jgi:spore coat polysaccharide biosynthesis protein SpsF
MQQMERARIAAIIQARMGSTRLPGKALEDIGGETMLARAVMRTKQARLLHETIVATTTTEKDNAIVDECQRLHFALYRGEEHDVLDRYYQAALAYKVDTIVRITSDCPLIDPTIIDRVIGAFLSKSPDYASNVVERNYPMGLDVEVMTMQALTKAWREADKPYERTHVTPYIYQNTSLFRLLHVTGDADYSHYRWTVDTPEDLAFVRTIYERFGNSNSIRWKEVIGLLDSEPELADINRHIRQKSLMEG